MIEHIGKTPYPVAKFAAVLLFAVSLIIPAPCEDKPSAVQTPVLKKLESPKVSRENSEKILKEVWTTVKEKHYDEKMNNVDWDLVYKEHMEMLDGCSNQEQLVEILNGMVKKLGQSHMHVLSPPNRIEIRARSMIAKETSDADKLSDEEKRQPGDVGLRLCLAEKQIRVLEVKPGSAGEGAGIKTGDMITSINGIMLDPSQETDLPINFIAQSMLLGKPGTELALEYVNSDNVISKVTLKRKPTGSKWYQLGVIPASAVCFEYRKLGESIAYVHLSPCFSDQILLFQGILPDLRTQKGLIIDMRNNPGGIILFPNAMGGWLSDKEIFFGSMKTRTANLKIKSNPQEEAFKGPIAVLIDGGTASVAEIFSAGLQDSGRASLFGEVTSGACLPSMFMELSMGYRLQTVTGDFTRANGKAIEKIGVTPDFPVSPLLLDLKAGKDTAIEAAKIWLLEKFKKEENSTVQQ